MESLKNLISSHSRQMSDVFKNVGMSQKWGLVIALLVYLALVVMSALPSYQRLVEKYPKHLRKIKSEKAIVAGVTIDLIGKFFIIINVLTIMAIVMKY